MADQRIYIIKDNRDYIYNLLDRIETKVNAVILDFEDLSKREIQHLIGEADPELANMIKDVRRARLLEKLYEIKENIDKIFNNGVVEKITYMISEDIKKNPGNYRNGKRILWYKITQWWGYSPYLRLMTWKYYGIIAEVECKAGVCEISLVVGETTQSPYVDPNVYE